MSQITGPLAQIALKAQLAEVETGRVSLADRVYNAITPLIRDGLVFSTLLGIISFHFTASRKVRWLSWGGCVVSLTFFVIRFLQIPVPKRVIWKSDLSRPDKKLVDLLKLCQYVCSDQITDQELTNATPIQIKWVENKFVLKMRLESLIDHRNTNVVALIKKGTQYSFQCNSTDVQMGKDPIATIGEIDRVITPPEFTVKETDVDQKSITAYTLVGNTEKYILAHPNIKDYLFFFRPLFDEFRESIHLGCQQTIHKAITIRVSSDNELKLYIHFEQGQVSMPVVVTFKTDGVEIKVSRYEYRGNPKAILHQILNSLRGPFVPLNGYKLAGE